MSEQQNDGPGLYACSVMVMKHDVTAGAVTSKHYVNIVSSKSPEEAASLAEKSHPADEFEGFQRPSVSANRVPDSVIYKIADWLRNQPYDDLVSIAKEAGAGRARYFAALVDAHGSVVPLDWAREPGNPEMLADQIKSAFKILSERSVANSDADLVTMQKLAQEVLQLTAERDALKHAVVKMIGHTSHNPVASNELLAGLLASVQRIGKAALDTP